MRSDHRANAARLRMRSAEDVHRTPRQPSMWDVTQPESGTGPVACGAVRLYVAGPLFSEAERSWLDMLAARLRTEGFECFVPHEHFPELADVTLEEVYRIDTEGLRS